MSDQPWESDHWSVSPHNFDPNVIVEPHHVELHDITIRDGEECADLAYNVDDKVRHKYELQPLHSFGNKFFPHLIYILYMCGHIWRLS